ncbi:hypothetical protein C0992_004678 [Termitomyces sp. T32_za158]|nr:hypothetical protein C0992_004678 [Termitomyces sp. T32_za158]
MAAAPLNNLMQVWGARHSETPPPFSSKQHLHQVIDSAQIGGVPWQSFSANYSAKVTDTDLEQAPWKLKSYDVWFCDPLLVLRSQLGNPDFKGEMDLADALAQDPALHGSVFCPIILGSDKTTVSVATGQTDYYPLYMSNGLIHNNVQRAHRNGLTLIAFLSIPKTDAEHRNSDEFRHFQHHLFHESLRYIFETVRPYMNTPDIVRFAEGHFHRVVYGMGPYIADYPEQALLACIVQGWCARCTANFKNLDGPDGGRRTQELTQTLKGVLGQKALWDDYGIVSEAQPFTQFFPRADIHELIAPDLLHQLIKGTFKDHLVTWVVEYIEVTYPPAKAAKIIADIDRHIAAVPPFPGLRRFPEGRGFKQWTGDDSKALMKVYLPAIAGHVPAEMVKTMHYFLEFCYLANNDDDGGAVEGRDVLGEVLLARKPNFEVTSIPLHAEGLAIHYNIPALPNLISLFLYEQAHPDLEIPLVDIPIEDCPAPSGRIRVYPSAVATFYAPSNISGIGGMFRERIRAVSSWHGGPARYDFSDEPCPETGMWVVEKDRSEDGKLVMH